MRLARRYLMFATIFLLPAPAAVVASTAAEVHVARDQVELWASLSNNKSVLLTLRPDGKSDYELLTRSAGGKIRVLRSPSGSWGVYDLGENTTWPPLAQLAKAKRHLWVQISLGKSGQNARIDFAEIDNELLEVDAAGISGRFVHAEDALLP